jgi:hypothetical protein
MRGKVVNSMLGRLARPQNDEGPELHTIARLRCAMALVCATTSVASCGRMTEPEPTSLSVLCDTHTLNGPGLQTTCHASATRADGTTTDQTNLAAWSSSDSTIASVSARGVVQSASPGSVQIRATLDGQTGSDTIVVSPLPPR